MRAAAEVTALFPERSADPLEHVDYRLAETPEEKDEIYRLRYRAYLREGAILPSESERVTDRYDDAPNNFGRSAFIIDGELYSSIRISVSDGRVAGAPRHPKCSATCCIPIWTGAKSSSTRRALWPIPTRRRSFPGTALCNRAAWLCGVRPFQRRYRACQCPPRASGVLSARCSCRPRWANRVVPWPDQAGRTDGRQLSRYS